MTLTDMLYAWNQAISPTHIRWYLYRETLLCANGYRAFPEELSCAQVVMLAEDLPAFWRDVVPQLPADWQLQNDLFQPEKPSLRFTVEDGPALTVDLLCAVEDAEHAQALVAELASLRKAVRKDEKRHSARKSQAATLAMDALIDRFGAPGPATDYYCDCLTDENGTLLEAAWLNGSDTVTVGETAYPVFAGYRAYLAEQYGDYENGLVDDIGCGLTVEEKAALKQHQENCVKALAFVEQLAQKHGLRYYLLAGSVLGAVRHGGLIPWDDDIDIGIRIEDLDEFERLVKAHLPDEFTLEQAAPNHPYPRMFSKICCDDRCCIDLWPLVPTYTKGLRAKFVWTFAKIVKLVHYHKVGREIKRNKALVRVASRCMTDRMAMWLARRNERLFQHVKTTAYVNLYSIYPREKETIRRVWLDTEARANFSGLNVPIVGCTDEYLTHLYGDYRRFPAPWSRISRHVDRFHTADQDDGPF